MRSQVTAEEQFIKDMQTPGTEVYEKIHGNELVNLIDKEASLAKIFESYVKSAEKQDALARNQIEFIKYYLKQQDDRMYTYIEQQNEAIRAQEIRALEARFADPTNIPALVANHAVLCQERDEALDELNKAKDDVAEKTKEFIEAGEAVDELINDAFDEVEDELQEDSVEETEDGPKVIKGLTEEEVAKAKAAVNKLKPTSDLIAMGAADVTGNTKALNAYLASVVVLGNPLAQFKRMNRFAKQLENKQEDLAEKTEKTVDAHEDLRESVLNKKDKSEKYKTAQAKVETSSENIKKNNRVVPNAGRASK